jgi:hypothetical protein
MWSCETIFVVNFCYLWEKKKIGEKIGLFSTAKRLFSTKEMCTHIHITLSSNIQEIVF